MHDTGSDHNHRAGRCHTNRRAQKVSTHARAGVPSLLHEPSVASSQEIRKLLLMMLFFSQGRGRRAIIAASRATPECRKLTAL